VAIAISPKRPKLLELRPFLQQVHSSMIELLHFSLAYHKSSNSSFATNARLFDISTFRCSSMQRFAHFDTAQCSAVRRFSTVKLGLFRLGPIYPSPLEEFIEQTGVVELFFKVWSYYYI